MSEILATVEAAAEGPPTLEKIVAPGDRPQPPKVFNIWTPEQFIEWQPPKRAEILFNEDEQGILNDGFIAGLVGAGGVGKSRIATNLAVAQILGKKFCGLRTGDKPRKWLFIGNENSIRRWHDDFERIFKTLSAQERELVTRHLGAQAQSGDVQDLDLAIGNGELWQNTIAAHEPDVLVVDPFEAVLAGDVNNAGDVRSAITWLRSALSQVKPNATLLFVHHARTGRAANLSAVGFDGNNFAKGSKSFTSICRLQLNIAAADEEGRGVVLAVGKSNDAAPFKPFCAMLDPETMTYRRDETFSLADWKLDVEGTRSGKACTIKNVLEAFSDQESLPRKEILEALENSTGASLRTRNQRIKDAAEGGFLTPSAETRGEWMLSAKGRNQL